MSKDESIYPRHHLLLLLLLVFLTSFIVVNGDEQKNFYIVYMGDRTITKEAAAQRHIDILSDVTGSVVSATESIVHSYTKSFNAFAAKLSPSEATMLATMNGVISVFPNRYHKPQTTRSWDFIGFPQTVRRRSNMESNIIVGLIDTGINPESESFSDKGFGPPPVKWKGTCGPYANFSGCNNKLIGARYFKLDGEHDPSDILSPVDVQGHGSHTSSTAAGNPVESASLYGLARGTARGAVPSARIAAYKACWVSTGCSDMDLLAAFDAAITDGVDVISISVGEDNPNYVSNAIAIGSFHAMKHGIITTASAGNEGPSPGSLSNHAPWILTVAASGMDRSFRSTVVLGNGKKFYGIGVNFFSPKRRFYPLVSGADAAMNSTPEVAEGARFCMDDALDPAKVKGKLVHCELMVWGADSVVKRLGGIGTILESSNAVDVAQIFMAPGTMVDPIIGQDVSNYINSTRSPSAVIFPTQQVNISAPFVASFSSRGPNPGSKRILKPDIAAPGIDILAAYTPLNSLTGLRGDTQYSKFTLMSGTSMACPHVAGVAAYVKSFHPTWSPAAIKSAIITTATAMSPVVNNDAEFAYGAGLLNPIQAVSPGLVYDMDYFSYLPFLCEEGYGGPSLGIIVGSKAINCSSLPPARGTDALNYPTMQLSMKKGRLETVGVFLRRVTNVGPPAIVYKATVHAPYGVRITVKPTILSFSRTNQKRSFKVVVRAKPMRAAAMLSGSLVWRSSYHTVRSPIVVYEPQNL
ncbi:PREDICTED: subtilisin-like protease SBT4.14 [Nelumbo nucifera]|uniref:Subtilisin-like protease SBT4.14 n=2 Tax=Nelumbo nucifera TaxID=4432 RepID=A0A1U7ZQA1_NELNU|nr:PREDICTED: subtilisin-like protease SBT4.14 [Nelumbo nucifera]DAD18736.1 TPA_asm: hypothetical protein HUJ06_020199 [Nelumbo nucifera]